MEFYEDYNRTYCYYLSQYRIRIEMAFGRLTTKWRILRRTLNYSNAKNAKIICACTKLHNFCIRMHQLENDERGWVCQFSGEICEIFFRVQNCTKYKVKKYLHSLVTSVIRYMLPSFAVGSESADCMPRIEAKAPETVDLCSQRGMLHDNW